MFDITSDKVYVKTFGGFDLYYKGELIYFSNGKAKELLAVLVDWRGKAVTLSHLAGLLSDGERDEAAAKQAVHLAWHRLKQTLKQYGIEKIVIKGRGTYAINKDKIVCDSYDMVRQVKGASNYFVGEYMPEYSWAEVTLSSLIRDYFDEEYQDGQEKSE